ncbi:cytochrome b5-like steroid-binding protein [Chloropicon roscoffensis]|uniref:Cytochrome b5-like steroid-binding protein n=1 Tax=Chloropicon roscoffensis TaxID=1461544 RepID=A0A7S3C869_9CHLO
MDKAGQVWEAWQELVIGRADPIVVMTTSMLAIAAVPVVLTWLSMRRHKKREGKKEDEEAKPEAKPSHHGNLTKEELKEYTGKDSSKPLLVAINGKIYDVTSGSDFYGPEGPYNLFTGIDASRALAKMSFKPEDLAGGTDDLSQSEKDILFDWEQKFKMKYKYVGDVVP